MGNSGDRVLDGNLVNRCLRGDEDAWECLVRRYEGWLLNFIKYLFKIRGGSPSWAEDTLANTWEYLVVNRFQRLRHFDPAKGSLATFLGLAGRDQVNRFFHDQWIKRRVPLENGGLEKMQVIDLPVGLILEEYLAKLSPVMRAYFLDNHLGTPSQHPTRPLTKANSAKLEQRLLAAWRTNRDLPKRKNEKTK